MKRANCLPIVVRIPASLLVAMLAGCGGSKTGGSQGVGGATQGVGGVTGIGGSGGASQGTGGATTGAGGVAGTGGSGTGGFAVGGSSGSAAGGNKGTGGAGSGSNPPGTGGRAAGGAGGTGGGGGIDGGTADAGAGGIGTGGTKPDTGGIASTGGAATGGTPGTGGSTPQACPDSASYVGDSTWPDKLVVTAGATYCGHFKEMRNLEQEYAAKAKLTLAPGTYFLPSTAGTYDFALPVCFERRPGEPVPAFAGAGQAEATQYKSTVNTYASSGLAATQPISLAGSPAWLFSMRLSYFSYTGPPQPPVLDGSYLCHPSSGEVGDTRPGYLNYLDLCQGTECDLWQDLMFEACSPDYPAYRHTVTFAGGQIVLDVRITGKVGGSTMLSAFTSAAGTLDGKAFTQTDYWKLVYSADHHHFNRQFAVLFDAPIGDACGLKVLDFWGSRYSAPLPEVYTVRCDLTSIAALAVSDATVEPL